MRAALTRPALFGVTIALSAGPSAAFSAGASDAALPAFHGHSDLSKSRALAPELRLRPGPSGRVPEIDGLSRDDDDCAYGCIDH